jgi:hypothetical protein
MRGSKRRGETAEAVAYYLSLPERRAGALMLALFLNAVVTLLLDALLLGRLAVLVRRRRARRAEGRPRLLIVRDASRSDRVLVGAVVLHHIARRLAVAALRRRTSEAIRNGSADPEAAARILADPVLRATPVGELRDVGPTPEG